MSHSPQPGPVPVIISPSAQPGEAPQQWIVMPAPAGQPDQGKPKEKRLVAWALLLATILVHTAINIFWLHTDEHLIRLDEAHHMKQALAYHDTFFAESEKGAAEGIFSALSIESPYPPLLHIVGALCIRYLGGSPDSAALTGSIALALLLIAVHVLCRFVFSPKHSFFVALLTSLIPMVYGYSRLMMPDTFMAAWLLWCLVALIKTGAFHKPGWSVISGCLAALALLSKQNALIYLTPLLAGAFIWGLKKTFSERKESTGDDGSFPRVFLNLFLFLCACFALCGWWYGRHADYLYGWWSSSTMEESSFFQAPVARPLSRILPATTAAPALIADPDLPLPFKEPLIASEEALPDLIVSTFYEHGLRYMFYAVNNALMLPLAAVSALGVLALLFKRNRNFLSFVLLSWLVSLWVLLTGVFALHSPRFLYPMMPVFAFFAFLALNTLSNTRIYRAAWALVFIILSVQFVNLSFLPPTLALRLELPVFEEEEAVSSRGNQGLALIADEIQTGHYLIHPPHREQPITGKVVAAMKHCDKNLNAPDQAVAWYQVVSREPSLLALDFHTRTFPRQKWFGIGESEETEEQLRPLAAISEEVREAADTLPEISGAEFVILEHSDAEASTERLETDAAFFMQQGFWPVFSEAFTPSAISPAGGILLMVRQPMRSLEECTDLFSLYDLLDRDGREWLLSDDERMEAEQRYTGAIRSYTTSRPLNKGIHFLGIHLARATNDCYVIRLIIHARQQPEEGLRVWLRAVPESASSESDDSLLSHDPGNWDFDPQPPSGKWGQNQALVLSRPVIVPQAGSFHLEIGIYDPEKEDRPVPVLETEVLDFSEADPLYLCGNEEPL
ncbi:MAG: hypothetical protein GX130_04445 [Candidatus Hydrogenedens sp.]|nr:hypothetical protein [Candidatus Hydrogenedens sp.]